ncbi:MAG: hypothetical protein Q4D58_10705 [Synergistaceae bacterium]|nr:hypothetical protein [Synergistaceae bacterium]
MRKCFVLCAVLLLAVASCACAASWTVGGTWNYTVEMAGTYEGVPATAKETGTVVMNSSMSGEVELLGGYAISYNGNVSIPSENYSYDYKYSYNETFSSPVIYTPGATLTLSYSGLLDDVTVRMTLRLTQTAENTITGTATMYIPLTGETNHG